MVSFIIPIQRYYGTNATCRSWRQHIGSQCTLSSTIPLVRWTHSPSYLLYVPLSMALFKSTRKLLQFSKHHSTLISITTSIALALYGIIYTFICRRWYIISGYTPRRCLPWRSLSLGVAKTPSLINLFFGLVIGNLSFGGAYSHSIRLSWNCRESRMAPLISFRRLYCY